MQSTDEQQGSNGKHLLITGATGFIGGKLAAAAILAGFKVHLLVRPGHQPQDLDGAELVEGDLLDPLSLAGIESGIDHVIHCAGILGKWGMAEGRLFQVNVQGSRNLLERFTGSAVKRFIHLSAGGVSGPLPGGAVDETYACKPATEYEQTKLEGERLILERSSELGIPAVVLRPTFTYGPGDPHKVALFRAIKKRRYAFIGDGKSVVHPVFIDDLIGGMLIALERSRVGEIYIIGGERPVTKQEMAYVIADCLGVRRPGLKIPRWFAGLVAPVLELLGRGIGFEPILTRSRIMMMADNFGYSIEKARRELGYEPKTGLDEGISRTIAYYEDHRLL